ncbi:hypothetical protein K6L44_12950 [Gluconacetobacter entanii]|uniref:hypothetical protein n=1 Tax=Gluconacetobacter entanii TaxID=108528 RepID=UPI001C933CA5|nr:hypothetical protein [Gluconacetobacter entanii]MBY4640870.1 hypothetical protein [Gluconacetobacter entanii]MCW4581601.1 hypothetical protein [Gluconacetobacter entanii]MCW4584977.1 hypothetical protein [Gluconacetobacter entanii]MCW4588391.1 hypothetical protein [Gluconacetobacter entanii]
MLESTIIEIDGIFVGTAIVLTNVVGRRFYATHDSVRALHNVVLPDLSSLRRRVTSLFRAAARPAP